MFLTYFRPVQIPAEPKLMPLRLFVWTHVTARTWLNRFTRNLLLQCFTNTRHSLQLPLKPDNNKGVFYMENYTRFVRTSLALANKNKWELKIIRTE